MSSARHVLAPVTLERMPRPGDREARARAARAAAASRAEKGEG